MDEFESLSHTKWDCKYHVVFIPKCRRKTLYGQLRQHLGEVFKRLAAQKERSYGAAGGGRSAFIVQCEPTEDVPWPKSMISAEA